MSSSVFLARESDVLKYCNKRLDLFVMDAIIKSNSKGLDSPGLNEHLQQGNYIPVLSAVWGERDKERRLEWLRKNADLHPPLMFERAIAEFVADPTVEKVVDLVIPLMHAASFRTHQDVGCLDCCDPESSAMEDEMYLIYLKLLLKAVKKYAPAVDLSEVLNVNKKLIDSNAQRQLAIIGTRTLKAPQTLPNPIWVSYHQGGLTHRMIPAQYIDAMRKQIVQKELGGKITLNN